MIQRLVDTYQCEWAAVVRDPEKRRQFRQFANTDETEPCIEIVSERGQRRPAAWPSDVVSLEQFRSLNCRESGTASHLLGSRGREREISPRTAAPPIKYGRVQIAVFNFTSRGEWYACQNMCPHKKAFVLSRGIVGDAAGVPKVACPLHKKTFSLVSGESLQAEEYRIRTFPVRVEDDDVYLDLPSTEVLDQELATEIGCRLAASCATHGCSGRRRAFGRCGPHAGRNAGGAVMPNTVANSAAAAPRRDAAIQPLLLVDRLLAEQQELTAVEQFARAYDREKTPSEVQRYRRLLPAAAPGKGQQYAFEVDLDRCSGCKACVTACHNLNGLDPQEAWRDVGLLLGGTSSLPVMQHVTTACHHCLEPACLTRAR